MNFKYIYILYNYINIFNLEPNIYKEFGWNSTHCYSSGCCCYSNNTTINIIKNNLLACCLSLPNKNCGCGLNKSYFLNNTFENCINLCKNNIKCKSINYNKNTNECWLYQEEPDYYINNTSFNSIYIKND